MISRSLAITPFLLTISAGCAMPELPQDAGDSADSTGASDGASDGADEPDTDTDTEGAEEASACIQQVAAVEGLLRERCSGCHDNGQTNGGLGSIGNADLLIENGYILRGDAAGSPLYKQVESKTMPLTGEPLAESELTLLREWITGCTSPTDDPADLSLAEPPACPDNVAVPFTKVLAAIRDDVVLLDNARARTTRYLTLAHLYGAGYCEAQIEGYRHALNKLLNHLSHSPHIRAPEPIDADRTIYRINLTDYGWTTATWKAITDSDPYAVVFQSEDALDIRDSADVDLFSVKADWFLDAASQPPLYHTILELPDNRFDLETSLGLNVDANIATELDQNTDDVVRAGFQISNVSFSNRVIERHQQPSSPNRAYWLSYDFAKEEEGKVLPPFKNIMENPLDFMEDGGEIIFNLPNGLQAYMLVKGNGERIDRGPIGVVHDKETPEEPEVINGVSCMSCHSEGMRSATDEVGNFVAGNTDFDELAQQQVARLYAPADVFARKLAQDIETFADAMALTGAPRRVGNNEPVMAAHLAFAGSLDLRRAAAEFGVPEMEVLKKVSQLVGLTTIAGATVTRDVFEDNFAANACILNLGASAACPLEPK